MYRKELDALIDAVETDDSTTIRSPYSDAPQTFELTLAIDEAIENE